MGGPFIFDNIFCKQHYSLVTKFENTKFVLRTLNSCFKYLISEIFVFNEGQIIYVTIIKENKIQKLNFVIDLTQVN